MSLKSCWRSLIHGTWTANRLLSRKWWLVVAGLFVAVSLDIAGRALGSDTLGYMRDVTVAYLTIQGALDWRSNRRKHKESDDV